MKLPNIKRIDKQNFPQQEPDFIDKLGFTLNNDMETLFNVLNRNASLKDNLFCTVKDVQVILDADGIPTNGASFRLDNAQMRVLGCPVYNAVNVKNSTVFPTGAPFINFSQLSDIITINHVTGLQPGQLYTLTIVAWGL